MNHPERSQHNYRHRRLRRSHDAVPQTMAREDQYRRNEPDHEPVCWLAYGFRHPHARWSQVGEDITNPSERLSSAQWIHRRPHLQQSIRMGDECARRRRVRTQNSRKEVSGFGTDRCA